MMFKELLLFTNPGRKDVKGNVSVHCSQQNKDRKKSKYNCPGITEALDCRGVALPEGPGYPRAGCVL